MDRTCPIFYILIIVPYPTGDNLLYSAIIIVILKSEKMFKITATRVEAQGLVFLVVKFSVIPRTVDSK